MKKTNTGYSIRVFVNDGEVAAALRHGIDLFFVKLEAQRHPDREKQLRLDAENEARSLREAHVLQ